MTTGQTADGVEQLSHAVRAFDQSLTVDGKECQAHYLVMASYDVGHSRVEVGTVEVEGTVSPLQMFFLRLSEIRRHDGAIDSIPQQTMLAFAPLMLAMSSAMTFVLANWAAQEAEQEKARRRAN